MIAILSDLHVCNPWFSLKRLERLVDRVNAVGADLILLAGDYLADRKMPSIPLPIRPIAERLARLRAPLGIYAVLGNHDWFDCSDARSSRFLRTSVTDGLRSAGLNLLQNSAVVLTHHDQQFWLVGFDSQRPIHHRPDIRFHDPEKAFAPVTDGSPAVLLAHEPDYFAESDPRAFLQISGHTHGGQINLGGWRPIVPSRFGARYAWGHVREGDRHLVVSGGIGCSGLPLRIMQPPEITLVTVSGTARTTAQHPARTRQGQ